MKKLLLLRLVIFLFLFVIMFVAYNSPNVYGANEKDVSEINKMLQSGFDEIKRWNPNAAIDYLNQAISLDKKNPDAYPGLANAYLHKGDPDQAIEYYNQALLLDKKNPHTYVGLGLAYSQKGNFNKAMDYFNQASLPE